MKIKREMLGWIVVESSDTGEIEQALMLAFDDELPHGGLLCWRPDSKAKATVFSSKDAARAAIKRTEHYRLAYSDPDYAEARYCHLVAVEYAQDAAHE